METSQNMLVVFKSTLTMFCSLFLHIIFRLACESPEKILLEIWLELGSARDVCRMNECLLNVPRLHLINILISRGQ